MNKIELIDRIALLEMLPQICDALNGCAAPYNFDEHCMGCEVYMLHTLLAEAPTIDAAPVRRSEWRYVNYQIDKTTWITGEFICRKCGKSIPRHMGDNPPDYCQHCGADMRAEDEQD